MKNLIYILLILGIQTYAQQFMVSKKGLRDQSASEKNYLVLNIDGKKASELYQVSLIFMNNDYLNPNTILKDKVDNLYVQFETSIKEFGVVKNSGSKIPVGVKYLTELRFKENKVKFTIVDLVIGNGAYEVIWQGDVFQGYVIWNKNDVLIRPELKVFIEDYFSKEIKNLKTYLSNYKDEDDW